MQACWTKLAHARICFYLLLPGGPKLLQAQSCAGRDLNNGAPAAMT